MEWTRGPIIGRGSTATVSLATALPSGELFAVKSAELSRSLFLQKEQNFLSQLSCPNIVKYIGFDIKTEDDHSSTYNLCMEYVPGGTLYRSIQASGGRLGEPEIRSCTRQILQGLEYLHKNGLVHCDVKSQNILMGRDGAKIADLGCARFAGDAEFVISGTPAFMAPEVARGEEQGFAADVWAVGCTVVEMATGSHPWPELNDPVSALYRIGFSGEVPEFPKWLSEKGIDFLSKCFMKDPRERWTVKELLHHPFLDELEFDWKNSPSSVLDHGFWDAFETSSEKPQDQSPDGSYLDSPARRIKKLISEVSNWSWDDDEDWVTVRSCETEETDNFSDSETEAVMASVATEDDDDEEEAVGSSVIDEDLFMHEYVNSNICIRRCTVKDDFVFRKFDYQKNETFSFLKSWPLMFTYCPYLILCITCSILLYFPSTTHTTSKQYLENDRPASWFSWNPAGPILCLKAVGS